MINKLNNKLYYNLIDFGASEVFDEMTTSSKDLCIIKSNFLNSWFVEARGTIYYLTPELLKILNTQ